MKTARDLLRSSFARFLISGAINTAISFAIYAALLTLLPYAWAYACAYFGGIALSWLMYRHFVFRQPGRKGSLLWVALVYAVLYLVGATLVTLWCDALRLPPLLAPLFSLCVQVPLGYGLNRLIFIARRQPPPL